jgi:hypothetical protein
MHNPGDLRYPHAQRRLLAQENDMPSASPLRFAFAALLLLASTAHAQLFRAYLSGAGNDANPCTLPAPCRLLPAALNAVASGGEIWMLDSANFNTGTVNINKSVSILAVSGVVGSLVALNAGPAIAITTDSLDVALRNVVVGRVAGAAAGTHGVEMTGASALTIENSVIDRLPANGVRVKGLGTLRLVNTTIKFCGSYAVYLGDGAHGTISGANIVNNDGGVLAESTLASRLSSVSISDSFISGVNNANVRAATLTADAKAYAFVTRSTIERSGDTGAGLRAASDSGGTASVVVSASTIASHTTAWRVTGAGSTIVSLGDNHIYNYTGVDGTLTTVSLQ